MESSPGVRLGNRLCLIGGSSVDPGPEIQEDLVLRSQPNAAIGWKDATVTFRGDFEERMGHACVIVDDQHLGNGWFGPVREFE